LVFPTSVGREKEIKAPVSRSIEGHHRYHRQEHRGKFGYLFSRTISGEQA